MPIFEVDKSHFDDLTSFNQHIVEMSADRFDGELYVVTGICQYSEPEFKNILRDRGYSFERYGTITKISREVNINESDVAEGEDSNLAEYYLHFDNDTGVILFYTDLRKTIEIDPVIKKFLENQPGVHYLPITPHLFRRLREDIVQNEELAEVTQFVADRQEQSDIPSQIRPDISRTINYYAPDGLETLREMESLYGVRPRLIEFNVPNKAKFKLNREGVFGLLDGDITVLFKYIEMVIDESLSVKEAYGGSSFRMLPSTETLEVPVSEPTAIRLDKELQFAELDDFKSKMSSEDYLVADAFEQEGSVYFSAKIFDKKKHNKFRIKASEQEIRVYPQEEEGNLGSFLRFHEFIQNNVDPQASVKIPS